MATVKSKIKIAPAGIKEIPIKITKEEITEKALIAGELSKQKDELEDRFNAIKKDMKSQITGLYWKIHTQLEEISGGFETREILCEWHCDFDKNTKNLVRVDTGSIVEKDVVITDEELQMLIDTLEKKED